MNELEAYTPKNLKGQAVLITGGTTGIGRATARILAGLGAKVFITGRNQEPLTQTLVDTRNAYADADIDGITSDLAEEAQINALFEAFVQRFGRLDILINNVGLAADGITKGSYKEWEYVVETNLLSYMACAHKAARKMEGRGGHIVNIGSMSAETGEETGTVYVATKAGIRAFSAALRKEVNKSKIKVTLIEPGAVSTDMQPGGSAEHQKKIDKMEMLEAEDIAASVVFCLSQPERCDVVTMQVRPHLQLI
jgi:NADP-dependent 3-hydroxy acid dehydrogenase YdfG